MKKRTKWFAGNVNPVRPGLYETFLFGLLGQPEMRRWNGKNWIHELGTVSSFGEQPGDKWRGLIKEVK